MGIFSDVLLTVDYDRTLTGPDSKIPQRNLEAIQYFMENGGSFTMTGTAKSLKGECVNGFNTTGEAVSHYKVISLAQLFQERHQMKEVIFQNISSRLKHL